MPLSAEEMAWWRDWLSWAGVLVTAVATATGSAVWRTRGIIAAQEALAEGQKLLAENHAALAARVADVEATDRDMGRHCAAQRREILEELRKEVCSILTSALQDARIKTSDERSMVTTTLALHTQALGNIEKDIKAIFARLDRRHGGETYVPLGRRGTDYDE